METIIILALTVGIMSAEAPQSDNTPDSAGPHTCALISDNRLQCERCCHPCMAADIITGSCDDDGDRIRECQQDCADNCNWYSCGWW